MVTLRKNERSWAIEIISEINSLADKNDFIIKRAGGENTISTSNQRMFPDVLLYRDKELTTILQGWELKMPDVPITDEVFVKDAQRKAIALGLDSTVIWNFTYAMFYTRIEGTDKFEVSKSWENLNIQERSDVATYHKQWKKALEDIILTVNDFLYTHKVRKTSIEELISDKAIRILIDNNKNMVAEHLKKESTRNSVIKASIGQWWKEVSIEYLLDETDEFKAYAKNIILNWSYRILFAHLIKRHQQTAMLIDSLDYSYSPEDANDIFRQITSKCDFYNVFEKPQWSELLPSTTWHSLVEFSLFLGECNINKINQSLLQNILEGAINTTHREMNGQFTTPKVLARILAQITVHDWTKNNGDPCCGTGTIPRAIIDIKKKELGAAKAVETTWTSDKYQMPLQIANISMTSFDTINMAIRLFKKDVFKLNVGDTIELVNPADGKMIEVTVPKFGAICSNLPFVSFENIPADDYPYTSNIATISGLDSKSDICYSIAIHLSELLEDDGYLGIITSNSWLGTEAGDKFYKALNKYYYLRQVHISGKGRWFKNADVVTTILLLQKKSSSTKPSITDFYLWKKPLEYINDNRDTEKAIINSSLLGRVTEDSVLSLSSYTKEQIEELHNTNICYNALFHDVSWVLDIKDSLTPLRRVFSVIRGSRRGWDPMFFPDPNNSIEDQFLYPALVNARKITTLNAAPDRKAFCCDLPLPVLQKDFPGAYSWIMKFSTVKNGKGKPLPSVLKKSNMEWYEMRPSETAEIFTTLNPNRRLFFGRFKKPAFINQRLVGLNFIDDKTDKELCHALLNSALMQFFIEATGFGRGLGVLDMSKDHLANCYMLNPLKLTKKVAYDIKSAFRKVANKEILNVDENMKDRDWIDFNHTVFKAYGIDAYYDRICSSLMSLQRNRLTVKD